MIVSAAHRKLIDLKPSVFDALSVEAERRGISLKRHIENLLEESCPRNDSSVSPKIRRLIGSARPSGINLESIQDDRLQYLLSK